MTTKVMVSFPDGFLEAVDALAQAEQRSRSELVREALRHYMAAREGATRPIDRPSVRVAVAVLDELAGATPGTGDDSTADVRTWRDRRR